MRLLASIALVVLAGCVHRPESRSLTPLYAESPSRHVTLLGVDGDAVWSRARQVLESYELEVKRERRGDDGERVLELVPFSFQVPGHVSHEYKPARLVRGEPDEFVTVRHELSLHLVAHDAGLARLWFEGEVRVNDRPPTEVIAPDVVAHRLLSLVAESFPVVTSWKFESAASEFEAE